MLQESSDENKRQIKDKSFYEWLKAEGLKANGLILSGRVEVFNVICDKVTNARLMTIKPKTYVILVFDTDVDKVDILEDNIRMFEKCPSVIEVLTIPQVKNLEDELVRACDIKNATELFGGNSLKDFKADFIKEKNLMKKLEAKGFDICKLWQRNPKALFGNITNDAGRIKK